MTVQSAIVTEELDVNFTGPMEDRIAIRELCDQFCEGVMSKNMEMWGDTWAESCEWVRFGQVFARGRAAVVAEAQKMLDGYSSGSFFCNLGHTHVDGARATGRVYHIEVYFRAGNVEWYRTYFDDDYLKINGRWYFERRALTVINEGKFRGADAQ